ncbi:hypothetical protein ACQ27_gp426 [Klebsiella phage K64-1]|nr:hypothetical protein ACQ27_gp426 [Klebsiella phage K64-1]
MHRKRFKALICCWWLIVQRSVLD